MPYLKLTVARPLDAKLRHFLARHLTGLLAELLGKQAAVTAIRIESCAPDRWFVAGEPVAATLCPCHLDLYITAGSNDAGEKAAFIAAAHRFLSESFGPQPEASYIALHELPATSWGYAGQTQAARQLARTGAAGSAL